MHTSKKIRTKEITYGSKAEKIVMELLCSMHSLPRSKWKRLKENERKILRKIANDKKHYLRKKAITGLVLSNDDGHVQQLEKIIKNKKEDYLSRIASIISLGMSNDPKAETVLLQFTDFDDYFVKAKVAKALGKIGSEKCLPDLIKMAKDRSHLVKENAMNAKKMIGFRLRRNN